MTTFWYHGSIHRLEVGEVLRAGVQPRNYKQSSKNEVSITSEVDTAQYWASDIAKKTGAEQIYIYRIEPEQEPKSWREGLKNFGKETAYYEARCQSARVVEIIFAEGTQHLPGDISVARTYYRAPNGLISKTEWH